jgi:glycosyltransferase involved in cell wall biosynthesis
MKSVVMIAYSFPPEGRAGTYRALRFVRHLSSLGWQPTVVTLDTAFYERFDPYLLATVPPEIEITQVRNPDPWQALQARRALRARKRLAKTTAETPSRAESGQRRPIRSSIRDVIRKMESSFYTPDTAMGWIRPAVKATIEACRRKNATAIWATAGPVSSFVVAQRASFRTGVPYILDFRDAKTITFNEFYERKPRWLKEFDRHRMFSFLQGAQAVVFRYDTEAECYWRAYPGAVDPSRVHIIPNGYEGEIDQSVAPQANQCRILYTGTLSDYRYDTLLQALQIFKHAEPHLAKQLNLRFVGEGTEVLGSEAAALGLVDLITTTGAISHDDVIRLSRNAHVLLVLGRPPAMKGYELFAPAKLFGYLKAGRAIAGVLPSDEAKKILQRVGVFTVADVDSVPEIVALFRKLLQAWNDKQLSSLVPDPAACQNYSAEPQTHRLVCALERKPAMEPFTPGSVEIPPSLREELNHRASRAAQERTFISQKSLAAPHHRQL